MEESFEAAAQAAAENNNAGPELKPSTIEKKPNLWVSGVLSCMTSVLSLFGRADLMKEYDEAFYIKPDRIIESQCIGEGAQGKVHLATLKAKTGLQTVAIKYVQQIDDMTARHLRNIRHANIVDTMGVCINPPKYYIIMEYCSNGSLFEYMHRGFQFTSQQMLTWAHGIASGMRHIHDKNIIHRDLKSPNILLTATLTAKVSDFGVSRTMNGRSKVMSFAGTLNWMAPEVIRAEKYTNKVDVWSFAVVLWEMVTLQIPYYKMEQHAIMWGVGTDSISLPVPTSVPSSIHLLLVQCWTRRHILRPTFAMIIKSLELIREELMLYDQKTFLERQRLWAREARDSLEKAYLKSEEQSRKKIPVYTQLDLYSRRDLKDKKQALAKRLDDTNEVFYEICSIRLALETRERELAEKEKLAEDCGCGVHRLINFNRETSTSSESFTPGYRTIVKNNTECKLLVNLINDKPITTAVEEVVEDKINHNKIRADNVQARKDTVVEVNGNIIKARPKPVFGQRVKRGRTIADV